MKQTIKTIIFLAVMILTAGQAWGEDYGYIAYTQGTNDGGSLAFYKDAACTSGITITDGKSDDLTGLGTDGKVYIKVTPDATHQARGVTITIEKDDSSDPTPPDGVPYWNGEGNAPRRHAPSTDETITVVTFAYGIYCFVMPDDGSNVTVTATFPAKTPLTITAESDTKDYDGTALTNNSYISTGLVEGDVISSVTVTGSQTDVGNSANVPSGAVIKNADNVDVTDCYDITYVNGTLTVNALPTYAIIGVAADENGNKVEADVASATAGTQITLTITTADTYTLKSISATGVTLNGTGMTRTFSMPDAAVTVTATWEEKTQESATTEVTENVDIVDGSNATVTSVEVGAQTTSITISGTVSDGTNDVPVTSIANGVFTAENTANVKSLDLSHTAITLTGDARDANGPLANVDENTLIYLPATASATGVNVVKTDGSCAEVKIGEAKSFVNSKGEITTKKFSFDRIFLTGENQLNTVFLPVDVPAAVAATFGTFYTCSSVDANGAVLSVVTGGLTANTAYVFKPASGKSQIAYDGSETLTIKVNANITNPTGAGLKGTNVQGTIATLASDDTKAYGYAAETDDGATVGAFYKLKPTATVPAYRAWLEVTDASSPQLAIIIEGEGTTGIRSIDGIPVNEGICYDLNGRKVNYPSSIINYPLKKGVYIMDGHKVFMK